MMFPLVKGDKCSPLGKGRHKENYKTDTDPCACLTWWGLPLSFFARLGRLSHRPVRTESCFEDPVGHPGGCSNLESYGYFTVVAQEGQAASFVSTTAWEFVDILFRHFVLLELECRASLWGRQSLMGDQIQIEKMSLVFHSPIFIGILVPLWVENCNTRSFPRRRESNERIEIPDRSRGWRK